MKDKISIIIPAYNIQDYLGATLDSVLAQTYENLEIIVVNDGSTDGTADVMDAYVAKDHRIKVIHKENGGVTSARLCGVNLATGNWIGFVDGDDYVAPQMYQLLIENALKYDADISHCGYQMVFPSRVDYYYNTGRQIIQEDDQGCTDLLEGKFVEPALWNKLYRKELFEELEGWMDKTIRINEDLLMNFFLFRQAEKAVFKDICPYHYVLRKDSTTTSRVNEHKLRDPLRVLHILHEETANIPLWNVIVERRLIYQLINMATLQLGDQKQLIIPVRRDARRELRLRLFNTLCNAEIGVKLKIMALWVSICPASYGCVHAAYAYVTGNSKKYEVK